MSIFSSGSCRLLNSTALAKVRSIHTVSYKFKGDKNFLGKLHNTKQHIQFIKYLRNEITIPKYILLLFLSNYKNKRCDFGIPYSKREEAVKAAFDKCEIYIFEICSIKIFEKDNYQLQVELLQRSTLTEYTTYLQTEAELVTDLTHLRSLVPKDKKMIFQCHFRPNVIFNNPSLEIKNRELIHKVLTEFCKTTENTYLHDPNIIISNDKALLGHDDTHFSEKGHLCNIKELRKLIRM